MKKIVLFNGPKESGKDVCAALCSDMFRGEHIQFKEKLFEIAMTVSGIPEDEWWRLYNHRDTKEAPCDSLGGLSPRQFLIKISEEWVKPVFGESYFGDQLVDKICSINKTTFFCSDSGFIHEAIPLMSEFGANNVLLVRIFRPGYTFEGDSRDYLSRSHFNYAIDIHNNKTLNDFKKEVLIEVNRFINPSK